MDNKPSTWLKVKKNPRVSPKGILSEQNEFTKYQLSHGSHGLPHLNFSSRKITDQYLSSLQAHKHGDKI